MGASKSKSKSSGSQTSQTWDYGSALNVAQEGYLNNLWGGASSLMQQQAGQGMGMDAYNQANQMNQAASGTLNRLMNPGMDPMMDVYAKQVGQQFNRQIMPALQGQAIMAGGLGGSRAGIAQGLAASDAQQNIQNFGAQLYSQNQDRALQAANAQGALAQNALATGQFGMGVPWYAMQQFGGLLGAPIMEDLGSYTKSTGTSKGSSGGFGFSL